jgi:pimeloyl-ACP methyl ester carboxylesterase
MPAVFVHGNPETSELWTGTLAHLGRSDTICLSLPGFGSPRPEGFTSTMDAYADWLVAALAALGEPVDLVGHDWGGILTVRAATLRPDLLRSWASDALGFFDERYEWHQFAKVWQTPGAGEKWVASNLATPLETRAAGFEAFAVPHDAAMMMAGWMDATLGESMLSLYRSATNVGVDWGSAVQPIRAPGLRINATTDPFAPDELGAAVAERVGARTVRLEGLGHWWMLQDPAQGAHVLEEFWGSLS